MEAQHNQTPPTSWRADGGYVRTLRRAIRRHRLGIAATLGVTLSAAGLVTVLQSPVYEGESLVRIETQQSGGLSIPIGDFMPAGMGSLAGLGGDGKLEADIMVLRSRTIAEEVVRTLGLQLQVEEPGTERSEVLRVVRAPRSAPAGEYELRRRTDGAYDLSVAGARAVAVRVGEPFRLGEFEVVLEDRVARTRPERIAVVVQPFREAVKDLREQLEILRPDQSAPMVSIRYRTTDPVLAAAVANQVTERFVEYKARLSQGEGRSTVRFLQEQLDVYAGRLRESEEKLERYRQSAQIINPGAQSEEQVRQLAELQARRDQLMSDRTALDALFRRLQSASSEGSLTVYRQLASYPAFLSNGAVQGMLQALTQLENDRAEALVKFRPQSQEVLAYDRRIAELEAQLYQMGRTYLRSLDDQLGSLNAVLSRTDASIATVPAREVEFMRLAREQKLNEQVYTLLQTKLKEAEIQTADDPTGVQVVDPALVPEEPLYPRPLFNLGLAGMLGLLLGIGGALTREMSRPAAPSREEVRPAPPAGARVLG